MHERPEERALRAGPRAGMLGLAEGHVDVVADAMVTLTTEETVGDAGVTVTWEPPDRAWALDASVRGILSTAGSGWYADTFIDVFGAGRWSLVAGLFAEGNFDVTFQEQGESSFYDQAEGGFLRASVDLAR